MTVHQTMAWNEQLHTAQRVGGNMARQLTPEERAILAAKHRLEWRASQEYIDISEHRSDEELQARIREVIENELTPDERIKLKEDKGLEFEQIRRHFADLDLEPWQGEEA